MSQLHLQVERWNEKEDGPLNEANMEKKLQRQGYTFTRHTFCPGTDFPDHTHGTTKKDAILSGRMEFVMYGRKVVLEPGDMVLVPMDTVHSASVLGSKPVVFYDSYK